MCVWDSRSPRVLFFLNTSGLRANKSGGWWRNTPRGAIRLGAPHAHMHNHWTLPRSNEHTYRSWFSIVLRRERFDGLYRPTCWIHNWFNTHDGRKRFETLLAEFESFFLASSTTNTDETTLRLCEWEWVWTNDEMNVKWPSTTRASSQRSVRASCSVSTVRRASASASCSLDVCCVNVNVNVIRRDRHLR